MLVEKAFAKLHGCYESLSNGLIEKSLQDVTTAAHISVLRTEKLPHHVLCDRIWTDLEHGLSSQCLIGCGRWLQDAYSESPADRRGITLG